ncbi:MAG: LutC/YkgG family protein [Terriglobales bacterium]
MSNPSRERMLGRITAALQQKSPPLPYAPRPIFAPISDLKQCFELECQNNYTECFFTRGIEESQGRLLEILASLDPGTVFAEDMPFIRDRLPLAPRDLTWSSTGPVPESSQATITRAKALIAATGSVLVTSSCGGRGGSIVAPVHIVLAHESQLLPDIEAALVHAEREGLPPKNSFIGIITGCSRTADIEKLLVIGAHGPKRLVVIVES